MALGANYGLKWQIKKTIMEIKLKNLLQRTLVVPYDEEEIECLKKVCEEYVNDKNFDDDTVADLAIMVLTHTPDKHITKKLSEFYEKQKDKSLTIPRPVCEALAAHTIYKAISNGYIANNLALLNCMVLMNKRWEHTPFPELFGACVERSLKEVDCLSHMEDVDDTDFLTKLYSENNELENSTLDIDMLKYVKRLARDAWYYRIHEYINSLRSRKIGTYAKVYVAIDHIVSSMPWNFLNDKVVDQIKEIVPSTNAKVLTIEEIADIVRPYYDKEKELCCRSSLLLHVISDKEHRATAWPFMKTTLTVREFAVYLYYELILEKYFE